MEEEGERMLRCEESGWEIEKEEVKRGGEWVSEWGRNRREERRREEAVEGEVKVEVRECESGGMQGEVWRGRAEGG